MALPETAAGLAGVALFLAAGLGLTELLPGLRRTPLLGRGGRAGGPRGAGGPGAWRWPARLGFAYPLGLAWTAGGLFALSHVLAVPLGRPAALALAGLPAAAGLLVIVGRVRQRARRPGERPSTFTAREEGTAGAPARGPEAADTPADRAPLAGQRLTRAAAIVGAVVSLAVWAEAATNPVRDWDGRMTWVTQARYVRAERSVDAAVLRGRQWYVTHPRYPLLLPLAQIAVLDLAGLPDDSHAFRAFYAAFFPAFLLILHAGARRWAGPRAAALVVLAACLVPFLPFYDAGGAGGAYSDLPLACLYGAGLLLLLEPRPDLSAGAAAGLLLAGAALAKNEGALLALWALAVGGVARCLWRRGRAGHPERSAESGVARLASLSPLFIAALAVALALALLLSWRAGIPNRYDERYEEIASLGTLLPNAVRRLPIVAPLILRTMFSGRHWTLLWWVAPVVFWAGRRGLRHRLTLPLALAALAPPAIAWGAYAVFSNPGFLAAVTWNRFLVQASIPGLLLLALALRGLLAGPLPAWLRPALGR